MSVEAGTAVLVFARAPIPGEAKTRLIPRLGAADAARLHARMTDHAIATACEADVGVVQLWCSPGTDHAFFQGCARAHAVTLHRQSGTTLGDRMRHAHEVALRRHSRIILIGTDCPVLAAPHIRAIAADLLRYDAAVIPAEDGGYVLLGLCGAHPEVFQDIAWSSAKVLQQTQARLHQAGLRYRLREPLWDVDRPEDYERLNGLLPAVTAGLGSSVSPHSP